MSIATVTRIREDFVPDDMEYPKGNPFLYSPQGRVIRRSELTPDSESYLHLVETGYLDPQRELASLSAKSGRQHLAPVDQSRMHDLAAQFAATCQSFLWTGENQEELREFLVGVLDAFQPRNRWELEMLANVADVQWKIRRTRRMQRGVYEAGSDVLDARGVKAKTIAASNIDKDLERLQFALDKAIATYQKARRRE